MGSNGKRARSPHDKKSDSALYTDEPARDGEVWMEKKVWRPEGARGTPEVYSGVVGSGMCVRRIVSESGIPD